MLAVDQTGQNIMFFALAAVWLGGGIFFGVRMFAQLFAYLHRFPPVEGYPLDSFSSPFLTPRSVIRAQGRALRQKQSDPELEAMRPEIWRRQWAYIIWAFAVPFLGFISYVVLFSTHILRAVP